MRASVLLPGLLALTCLAGASGCRKCDWPERLVAPAVPEQPAQDWSKLELVTTDVYVSLRRCRAVGRHERFLAIALEPLPAEFWRQGGMLEVYVDDHPVTAVMTMDDRNRVIYLHAFHPSDHEVLLVLEGPDGREIDRRTVPVDEQLWHWKRRRYEG